MTSTTQASEPLLVRVDPDTRARIKDLAASSDRKMSQLVRYAVVWWTTNPDRPHHIVSIKNAASNQSEFINIRFSVEDMDSIRKVADEMGLERGAVVRCAIRAWLKAGDFAALGDPRRVAAPEHRMAG